ncbi:hypothetical protein BCR36DRAFT_409209 [Piromyces finnis]|uniref:Uncharacterized protein n=1 Tax=Piromyces finnis TaxID=1754191 RepID=A0A1Y1VJ29_9FUNG|nr:hypothetical protein BCR36DRAFT_409209 [Piromyces finnis]|eukprot:ORX57730.1 hypothetical protein BCR36DRAFT_409209 [Piromyces finnis]
MSEHTLPILIINLIGELSYILQNRFKAYEIPFEKTFDCNLLNIKNIIIFIFELLILNINIYLTKVMEELYTEIFDPNNIIRYKFPQNLPNHIKPIRDSFNLLLKSLSFKILGGGYDKLFNMMIMSLKHHLINCRNSRDILNITEIHLESMIRYVQNPYTGIKIKQLKQRILMVYLINMCKSSYTFNKAY